MTWAESDLLSWDEREVLLAQADQQLRPPAPADPTRGQVPAAERFARRVG